MTSRLLTGKALVAFTAATLFSAGAAAAATGHLPDPVQHAVSTSLSHVGVEVPEPHESTEATDANDSGDKSGGSSTSSGTIAGGPDDQVRGQGPDANGPAQFGLCTAFLASVNAKGKNMDAPPFRNLAAAAAKAGMSLKDFCIRATTGSTTTSSSTSSTSTTAPTSTTSSTVDETPDFPGNSGNTPAATAPGRLAGHGNGHG